MVSGVFGSGPKPSAPTIFTFELSDLANVFPGLAGLVSLALYDVPVAPQFTADFCGLPPPTDVATVEDFALAATGIMGIASGAFRRLGNSIKAAKWSELCQWNESGYQTEQAAPGRPWVHWGRLFVYDQGTPITIQDTLPRAPGGRLWRAKLVADTVPSHTPESGENSYVVVRRTLVTRAEVGHLETEYWNGTVRLGLTYEDPAFYPWQATYGGQTKEGYEPLEDWDQRAHPEALGPMFYAFGYNTGGATDSWGAEIHIEFYEPVAPSYDAPTPPEVPEGYPTSGGVCEAPTLAEICQSLVAIGAKVDWIAANTAAPQIVVDPEPQPGPGPIAKPTLAVGAVVQITTVPAWQAHHGTSPTFWPSLGHVALMTPYGPLPSLLIKHNPMVILPIPPQVTEITLDLAEGAVGQVQWLNGPK